MPTYKITSPDGRVLRITGDTPPNEQQLQEIFSKVQGTQAQPATQGYQGIDYSDILNNKNLTKEQKVQGMQARTQAENKKLDDETNKKLAKMWAGGLLEIGSAAIPVGGGLKLATTLAKAGKPVAAKVAGAVLKNTPSLAASGGVAGLGTALKNDAKDINDYVKSIALGAGTGVAFGKGMEALGKGGQAALNSEFVKNTLPKVQEIFNGVPAEYSKRALEKELAGQSILGGKFDTKNAYRPVEEKLTQAKEMLPSAEDFAEEYYKLGKKASEGLENLKTGAGQDISEMLSKLSDKPQDISNLKNAISSNIKSYARGGNINPAEIRAGRDIEQINNILGNNATPIDLHNIKELLYDMANYDTAGGIRNDVIKGVANQINNYLRKIEPEYAKPNDIFSLIKSVEKDAGGLNPNTLGSKISNIGGKNNALSGLDLRLKNIDDLLPGQNKFFKQAQDVKAEQDAINEINNAITQKYLDNARPLADKSSIRFENAINDLQKRTGINFVEDLKDIRAREALERMFPGQGGGSGSAQGFGNLLRTSLIGTPTVIAAALTHNPAALLGLGAISPKISGKATIQGLGLLNQGLKGVSNFYDKAIEKYLNAERNLLTPKNKVLADENNK